MKAEPPSENWIMTGRSSLAPASSTALTVEVLVQLKAGMASAHGGGATAVSQCRAREPDGPSRAHARQLTPSLLGVLQDGPSDVTGDHAWFDAWEGLPRHACDGGSTINA